MNPSRKVRIGLIGAGGIVKQRHLPALKAMPEVEITAVCNSTYESSVEFCKEHLPHATPFKNWADVLFLKDLDVVWIGTTPYMHAPVTISALEAGKHVFCQARMAMNLAEAEEMLAAAEANPSLVTMLCPPPHGLRGDAVMRELLESKTIGELYHLRLRSLGNQFLDPNTPVHWRQRAEYSGLNVMTLGIYCEVLQRWIGPISKVSAHGRIVAPIRRGYEVKIPDIVSVLATFETGVEATLEFSAVAAFAPSDRLEIYGSEGKVTYDFSSDEIQLGKAGEPVMRTLLMEGAKHQGTWTVEHDFISAVRNPSAPRPHPDFEDGVAYMRVVQAVADSIVRQREIEILDTHLLDLRRTQ